MKKLHKLGTTILLSLTPAAALGITAGIVVANMTKVKEVSQEEWFKKDEEIENSFQSSKTEYQKSQITNILIKDKTEGIDYSSDVCEYCQYFSFDETRFLSLSGDGNNWFAFSSTYQQSKTEFLTPSEGGHYIIGDEYIEYYCDNVPSTGEFFQNVKINMYGCIISQEIYIDGVLQTKLASTYSGAPQEVRTIALNSESLVQLLEDIGIHVVGMPTEITQDASGTSIEFACFSSAEATKTVNIKLYDMDETTLIEDLGNFSIPANVQSYVNATFTKWSSVPSTSTKLFLKGTII